MRGIPERGRSEGPVGSLARQVRRRLVLERSLGRLARLSPWVGAVLLLGCLVCALRPGEGAGAGLLPWALLAWVIPAGIRAWQGFPKEQEALAAWDARTGRQGALATAWELEQRERPGPGEQLHYLRVLQGLETVRQEVAQGLDWPRPSRSWVILPLALAVLAGLSWREKMVLEQGRAAIQARTVAAKAQAEAIGRVAQELKLWSGTGGAEEAGAAIQELARRLQSLETDPAVEDWPGELEEQARGLEEQARRLGDAAQPWASAEFIRALQGQADTEGLGGALQDRNAPRGVQEAQALAELLRREAGWPARERLGRALRQAVEAAVPEDGGRKVVQLTRQASWSLQEGRWSAGAQIMESLAGFFRAEGERLSAQAGLERCAGQLRGLAGEIAGEGAERAGGADQQGVPPDGAVPLAQQEPLQQPGQEETVPVPGEPGQGNGPPVPGMERAAAGSGLAGDPVKPPVPGLAQPDRGETIPGVAAPVPGTMGLQVAQRARRLGGESLAGASQVPGLEAGTGRQAMRKEVAPSFQISRSEEVNVTAGEQGESRFREVQADRERPETAGPAREMETEFERVRESIPGEAALPLERREQVERYFRGLRRQLEQGG